MIVNKLKLNPEKSKCMLIAIGNRQKVGDKSLNLYLDGNIIERVNCVKYISLLVDNHLSWGPQINSIISKVSLKLAAFRRLQPHPLKINMTLYKAFVYPYFNYCDCVWLPNKTQENSLEKVQKSFVRMMTHESTFSYKESLTRLRLSSLADRRKFHLAIQVFKSLYQLSPPYLFNIFTYKSQISSRITRNSRKLYIYDVRTNMGKSTLRFRGAILWNSLDKTLLGCNSLLSFKNRYRQLYN